MRPLLPVLLVTFLACGGDDDGGGDAPNIDASASSSDAAADEADASAGGNGNGSVDCEGTPCDAPNVCCAVDTDVTCVAPESCEGFARSCDDPGDCGGDQYCCFSEEGIACGPAEGCMFAFCLTPADCPDEGDMCCGVEDDNPGVCNPECAVPQ